jgi:deoxyhypusine synthase
MTDDRETFNHDPIGHVDVRAGMTVGELVSAFGDAGFAAGDLEDATAVAARMFGDEDVTTVMGLAGAMVPAGMRSIVAELIADGYVDALVTTGATLTHDAIEAVGGAHHHGEDAPDGATRREHDEILREEGVDRIYDVYLPQEHFTTFESHVRDHVFPDLADEGTVSIRRLTAALGRANAAAAAETGADPGIAAAAHDADVPVFCPAVADAVLGLQAWMYGQTSDLLVDALADVTELTDLAHAADETGAFVVGGGVPKNFVLQTMLTTPGAYDYAVQLTMDPPSTGGLSGASLDEARSWGKLAADAANVSVYGDATITLPLVVAAAREWMTEDASEDS